jgi:hypothetical protein
MHKKGIRKMPLIAFDKPVQTRSEENGLNQFDTVQEALDYAKNDLTVWKISFKLGNERLRLVKHEYPTTSEWVLEGTQGALDEATQKFAEHHQSLLKNHYTYEPELTKAEVDKLSEDYHNHADEGRR